MRNLLSLFILIFLAAALSDAQEIKHHPFSGRLVFTAEGGASLGMTDYMDMENSYAFNGLAEYFFPVTSQHVFGLRLTAGTVNIKGKDNRRTVKEFSTNLITAGLGLIYSYSINDVVFPYVYGGASMNWFDPQMTNGMPAPHNAANLYDKNALSYDVEGGLRIRINDDWSVLASGALHLIQTDFLDDVAPSTQIKPSDFPAGPHDDFYVSGLIGVSYSLFGKKDSDGDGVIDDRDLCPNTPKGILIDENGCPLDIDGDGVPDYLDKCPKTPHGVKVDKNGCPVDSDNDGVSDDIDKCPGTPAGIPVNKDGCPFDTDGDGVLDYLDKCPDTPRGTLVDASGCPIDSDNDGVPDSLDKCPDTPIGVKVDSFGCEIKEESPQTKKSSTEKERPKEVTPTNPKPNIQLPNIEEENTTTTIPSSTSKIVINSDDTFGPTSSNIKPAAYANLNNIVNFLKKDPWTKWKVEGYVDDQVSDERKLSLSYERADAITKYFISKGLPSFQFQVYGLGDENPVAPNSTEEGRSKNRRVELTKIKK